LGNRGFHSLVPALAVLAVKLLPSKEGLEFASVVPPGESDRSWELLLALFTAFTRRVDVEQRSNFGLGESEPESKARVVGASSLAEEAAAPTPRNHSVPRNPVSDALVDNVMGRRDQGAHKLVGRVEHVLSVITLGGIKVIPGPVLRCIEPAQAVAVDVALAGEAVAVRPGVTELFALKDRFDPLGFTKESSASDGALLVEALPAGDEAIVTKAHSVRIAVRSAP
jgi:hypothetical protein